MLDKKEVSQEQSQFVNIANAEHGMTDYIPCPYLLKQFEGKEKLVPAYGSEHVYFAERYSNVKILIFKGELKGVFCSKFEDGNCKCDTEVNPTGKCFLINYRVPSQ